MSKEKYTQFRNYMTNELGVTKQDIEAWTKQSVATEIGKLLGRMNTGELIEKAIDKMCVEAINGSGRIHSNRSLMREAIAKELAKTITLRVSDNQGDEG